MIDTITPQTTVTAVAYDDINNQLLLQGTDFDQLLQGGERLTTDLTHRLDWSKLVIDINNDDAVTQDVTLAANDVILTRLVDSNTVSIQLSAEKAAEFEGLFGYQGTDDGIDVQPGFLMDAAGNAASITLDGLTIDYDDTVAPAVLQVRHAESGSYTTGDQIAIVVQLSEAVNIAGVNAADNLTKPSLTLNNGATAYFASGAGTDTLTFLYTVGSNSEASSALNYSATNALTIPAGTTITDKAGLALNTTLPALDSNDALAQNGTALIEFTAPDIVQVRSVTPDGQYNADKVLQIEVSLSESVNVTGTPALDLNSGGQALYVSGSGSDKLIFNYTVAANENVAELDVSGITGGTIADLAGNPLNTASLPTGADANSLASQAEILIDTVAPNFSITNFFFWKDNFEFDVDQPFPGGVGASLTEHFKIDPAKMVIRGTDDLGNPTTFTFNDNEFLLRVNPGLETRGQITLTTEAHERFKNWEGLSYLSDPAIGELKPSQDMTVEIKQGWFTDLAGNSLTQELAERPLDISAYLNADSANLATLEAITTTTGAGIYKNGDVINITVSFDQKVMVESSSGVPTLTLNNGQTATLVEGDGSKSRIFNFSYTIQGGDTINDLNVTSINANGGRFYGGGGPNSGTVDVSTTALNSLASEQTLAGSQTIHIDTDTPATTVTSVEYTPNSHTLLFNGTDFNDILSTNAPANHTELKAILDWSKLTYTGSQIVSFSKADILSAKVVDNNRLSVELTATKAAEIATHSTGDYSDDQVDISAGFVRNLAGNSATGDTLSGVISESNQISPELDSAFAAGNELVLTYTDALLGTGNNSDFTVSVNGTNRTVTAVAVDGPNVTVTFDGAAVSGAEQVLFSYSGAALTGAAGDPVATVGDQMAGYQHTTSNTLTTLIGDLGEDLFTIDHNNAIVTGGRGADTVDFNISGSQQNPADLVINDFSMAEGDVLKLDDLLLKEGDSLDQHLHFISNGSDTVMEIRSQADGDITKRVTFKNTDLFTLGSTDSEIINSLISSNSLEHGTFNEAPVAVAEQVTTDQDTQLTIDALANDTDPNASDNSANFSIDAVDIVDSNGNPVTDRGSVSIVDNKLLFQPGEDFIYLDQGENTTVYLRYTMSDDEGLSSTATTTVTVTGINDAATANPNVTTAKFELDALSETGDVLPTDTSAEGNTLNVTSVNGQAVSGTANITGTLGTLDIAADGTWTYHLDSAYANVDLEDALIARWHFDGDANDYAPSDAVADDGVLYGDTAYVNDSVSGSALTFDGSGDYVQMANTSELTSYYDQGTADERTISLFFKLDASNNKDGKQVLYEQGGPSSGFSVYLDEGKIFVGGWRSGAKSFVSQDITPLNGDSWHHIALVMSHEAGTLRGYLDGAVFGSANNIQVPAHSGTIGFGGPSQGTQHSDFHNLDDAAGTQFKGLIDEARIYDRALSETEVKVLGQFNQTETFNYEVSDGTYTSNATLEITPLHALDNSGTLAGSDSNNDTLNGSLFSETLDGMAGNDTLIANAGDDLLIGGAGDDILTGGSGADEFKFSLEDRGNNADPAEDIITDFNVQEGDTLNLADILLDEESNDLTQYLSFDQTDPNNAIMEIRNTAGGEITQKVTLQGVDISSLGSTDTEIINNLLNNGNLSTDH